MIRPEFAQTMARYNRWQNTSIFREADTLGDAARRLPRGAFFSSIHGTLNHLLWADQIWLHRFAGTPKPAGGIAESDRLFGGWDDLKAARLHVDARIQAWADGLDQAWLDGQMTWFSGAKGREISKPRWILVTHLFNHQTHHRGQAHAMLTAAGARPDATDLAFMPDE